MRALTVAPAKPLTCDGTAGCDQPVTMIDEKGFVYCTAFGSQRRATSGRYCRKLRPFEKRYLESGRQIAYDVRVNRLAILKGMAFEDARYIVRFGSPPLWACVKTQAAIDGLLD